MSAYFTQKGSIINANVLKFMTHFLDQCIKSIEQNFENYFWLHKIEVIIAFILSSFPSLAQIFYKFNHQYLNKLEK